MKIQPETRKDIVTFVSMNFRSFGGGQISQGNPVSAALSNNPPMFAAGVDIGEVVDFVLNLAKENNIE